MTEHDPLSGSDGESWDLGDEFARFFGDESEIEAQIGSGVEQRLRARSAISSATDLLGVGIETLRLLLNDRPRSADRDNEGR